MPVLISVKKIFLFTGGLFSLDEFKELLEEDISLLEEDSILELTLEELEIISLSLLTSLWEEESIIELDDSIENEERENEEESSLEIELANEEQDVNTIANNANIEIRFILNDYIIFY